MAVPGFNDEQQLWRQFQRGDEQAFRELYQAHVRHLLNYGLRLSGSLSVVEDCIQDLFAELWQYRKTLMQPASIRFYLLKGLRNRLNARYRKDIPYASGWDTDPELPFPVEPSTEQRLIELDMDNELQERVRRAMASLSPRQREILYLRYFNDLTYEQICDVTGINYQTARSQVYQALKTLRGEMKTNWPALISVVVWQFS